MTGFEPLGRMLLIVGALLFLFGLVLIFAGRLELPFGRLPGDIVYRRGNLTVYAPLVSCLVVSVLLTVVLNLIFWLLQR